MEVRGAVERVGEERARVPQGLPAWLLGLLPLLLIAAAVAVFVAFDAPGLKGRTGPPLEELTVERTVLRPGTIELTVRNDGPDAVRIAQVSINDGFADFRSANPSIGHLDATDVKISYPWVEGEGYEVNLLTSTGGTVSHDIAVATETPGADLGFYGLMALLGLYVGILPVTLGMLWLPFVRRVGDRWLRVLIALTIGLLGFLAIDATLEGIDVANEGSPAFGGVALVFLGAIVSYLVLTAIATYMGSRTTRATAAGVAGARVALLVAIAIGLHNLGEGLAIGSAYAVGALALGAFLVVGFALHNTTEGLAIVAPVAARPPSLLRLAMLGLVAGAPAIIGAWIGASAFNTTVAAFLLGVGAGAIVQVIQQLVPSIRDRSGLALQPASVAGIVAGFVILYATSLLVTV
jgi:ZIP family zinc transporter